MLTKGNVPCRDGQSLPFRHCHLIEERITTDRNTASAEPGRESKCSACLYYLRPNCGWPAKVSQRKRDLCWASKGGRILIAKAMKCNKTGEIHRPKTQSREPNAC